MLRRTLLALALAAACTAAHADMQRVAQAASAVRTVDAERGLQHERPCNAPIASDPLQGVGGPEHVDFVMKGGRVVVAKTPG